MNHILRLQSDLQRKYAEQVERTEKIQAFKIHLTSPKFVGVDTDGTRKDWIATKDVLAFLETL